jgi:hypothetical protein
LFEDDGSRSQQSSSRDLGGDAIPF